MKLFFLLLPFFFSCVARAQDVLTSVASEFFWRLKVTEEKLEVMETLAEGVSSAVECAAVCASNSDCNAFRYDWNVLGACEVGRYYNGDDYALAYNPGPAATYFKVKERSSDRCYLRFPGLANLDMMKEFCPRIGAKIVEFRSGAEKNSLLETITASVRVGLERDDGGVWRWVSDGSAGPTPTNDSGADKPCAGLNSDGDLKAFACNSRNNLICQFC